MASFGRWKIPQTRSGRRSISVGKLLERERAGTLFKKQAFELDGKTTFQGLDIAVENAVGSVRKGENADGTKWSVKYKTPYGYIEGTTGADDEEVDCYVGPKKDADTAFVVHQRKDDGSYDEDTVMLGYRSQGAAKADILRHYSNPKYVGKVVPVAMEKLKELFSSGEKLVKISTLGISGSHEFVDVDPADPTTLVARERRRPGDVPSREDVDPYPNPTVEPRQEARNSVTVGAFASPGGMDDMGKFGKVGKVETIGDKSRSWEVPTTEEHGPQPDDWGLSPQTAREVEARPPFHTLSEIGSDFGDKSAQVYEAFLDELGKLGAVTEGQLKAAADVTRDDAHAALERLRTLESAKPTHGQLLRGATVGALAGPIASNVSKLVSKGEFHTPREIAGQVAGGLILGTAVPLARQKIESTAERRVLKDYINAGHGGRLATQIESTLGTP